MHNTPEQLRVSFPDQAGHVNNRVRRFETISGHRRTVSVQSRDTFAGNDGGTVLAPGLVMMTIVLLGAGIWMTLSLLFVLALGIAARKPLPQSEAAPCLLEEAA